MFKPTSSSISSMVGALWSVNVYIFFVLTSKLKPKIQITRPRKNFAHRYYHGYSLTEVRISLSISTRFVLYPFTVSNKMSVNCDKKLNSILRRHYGFIMMASWEKICIHKQVRWRSDCEDKYDFQIESMQLCPQNSPSFLCSILKVSYKAYYLIYTPNKIFTRQYKT